MNKGIRRKIMVLVGEALEGLLDFRATEYSVPRENFPNALETPSLYITRGLEAPSPMTNKSKESEMPIEIIIAIESPQNIDLEKADLGDEVEEALMNLQTDDDFIALADIIHVEEIDPTPTALAGLWLDRAILPPYGVVRIRARVQFKYQAID